MTTYKHAIEKVGGVIRVDAVVTETEDDGHIYTDRVSATWHPEIRSPDGPDGVLRWTSGGYWLVSGDNTGSQNLIVHPHAVGPLRDLLTALMSDDIGYDAMTEPHLDCPSCGASIRARMASTGEQESDG